MTTVDAPTGGPALRRRLTRWIRANRLSYALLAVPAILVLGLIAYPVYLTVDMSLRKGRAMSVTGIGRELITWDNYRTVLTDGATYHSLWITVIYTGVSTAASLAVGLGTALLLHRKFPARRLLRTMILVPWAVPGVVASVVFLFMLDGSYGVVNWMLRGIGLTDHGIAWFFDPSTALIAVMAPTVWKGFPFFTLILLAALQSVPGDLYEAARVDGAGSFTQFRRITWPAIRGTAVLGTILNGLWAFHAFDFIYPLTQGGPNGATETWAIRIYDQAFSFFRPGSASSLGILATILAIVVVASLFPIMRREFF
jgi:multiple sugar transport system permease protein